jgi:MerR family mercuric resistance operon transcriptional regulator
LKLAAFTIGDLSAQTGVNIETIRYYEKIGLTPAPARSAGGRRLYTRADTKRLRFIRRARELGFTLEVIGSLLGLEDRPPSCAEVYAVTTRHLESVREKIADLRRLERILSDAAADCDKSAAPDCPIVDALSKQ